MSNMKHSEFRPSEDGIRYLIDGHLIRTTKFLETRDGFLGLVQTDAKTGEKEVVVLFGPDVNLEDPHDVVPLCAFDFRQAIATILEHMGEEALGFGRYDFNMGSTDEFKKVFVMNVDQHFDYVRLQGCAEAEMVAVGLADGRTKWRLSTCLINHPDLLPGKEFEMIGLVTQFLADQNQEVSSEATPS